MIAHIDLQFSVQNNFKFDLALSYGKATHIFYSLAKRYWQLKLNLAKAVKTPWGLCPSYDSNLAVKVTGKPLLTPNHLALAFHKDHAVQVSDKWENGRLLYPYIQVHTQVYIINSNDESRIFYFKLSSQYPPFTNSKDASIIFSMRLQTTDNQSGLC